MHHEGLKLNGIHQVVVYTDDANKCECSKAHLGCIKFGEFLD